MNTKMLGLLGLLAMSGSAFAGNVAGPVKHTKKAIVVAKAEEKKGAAPAKEEKKSEAKAEEKKEAAATGSTAETPDAGTPAKAGKKTAAPKK